MCFFTKVSHYAAPLDFIARYRCRGSCLSVCRPEKRSPCPYANSLSDSNFVPQARSVPAAGKKGVFFMTRNAPVSSELYIANADETNARSLLGNNTVFEYDAQWAPDGEWIILTSERTGDGSPHLWRVRPDGSRLEEVAATPAVETAGTISPDGKLLAFQGTIGNMESNIWIQDLSTGVSMVSVIFRSKVQS